MASIKTRGPKNARRYYVKSEARRPRPAVKTVHAIAFGSEKCRCRVVSAPVLEDSEPREEPHEQSRDEWGLELTASKYGRDLTLFQRFAHGGRRGRRRLCLCVEPLAGVLVTDLERRAPLLQLGELPLGPIDERRQRVSERTAAHRPIAQTISRPTNAVTAQPPTNANQPSATL